MTSPTGTHESDALVKLEVGSGQRPTPGYLHNAGLQALRAMDGPVRIAHSDLSGYSIFEEAAWWGVQAAEGLA